jgi:hypothetical protein
MKINLEKIFLLSFHNKFKKVYVTDFLVREVRRKVEPSGGR